MSRITRRHRTTLAYNPLGIFQCALFNLFPVWNEVYNVKSKEFKQLDPDNFGILCVDVYSRYIWGTSLPNITNKEIRNGLIRILNDIGQPYILSCNNLIADSIYKDKNNDILYPEFEGLNIYRIPTTDFKKNSIITRMIRTVKDNIIWYLERYLYPVEDYEIITAYNGSYITSGTDCLILIACNLANNRYNRSIRAIPANVFNELDVNHQYITHE